METLIGIILLAIMAACIYSIVSCEIEENR